MLYEYADKLANHLLSYIGINISYISHTYIRIFEKKNVTEKKNNYIR